MRTLTSLAAGAAFLLFPVTLFAQDLTPDSTRYLSDPNFLPDAGQIYGYSTYNHTWTSGDTFNNLDQQTSSFHVNTDTLLQFLSYGITDDLELNAQMHYDPDSARKVDLANGTGESFDSSGFSDPSFGVVWRALDQARAPLNFDLFGSYTPDWIDSKAPSSNDDGTIARGGVSGTAGAALGYETRQFSIRGAFNANFYGHNDTLNLINDDVLRTDGHTDYMLSLMTQTRINPLFSVNAGVDHTFAANQNALNLDTDIAHLAKPGDTTDLHAALNFNVMPNTAVVSATYTHTFLDNAAYLYTDPASNTSTRNRSSDTLGVRLDYLLP